MITKDDALKLALEAMGWTDEWRPEGLKEQAITALREALAEQSAQQQSAERGEPVAWAWRNTKTDGRGIYWENPTQFYDLSKPSNYEWTPLYTSPPASKPLTDEQISDIWCRVSNTDFVTVDTHEFARAIEAKLREKNEHREKNA